MQTTFSTLTLSTMIKEIRDQCEAADRSLTAAENKTKTSSKAHEEEKTVRKEADRKTIKATKDGSLWIKKYKRQKEDNEAHKGLFTENEKLQGELKKADEANISECLAGYKLLRTACSKVLEGFDMKKIDKVAANLTFQADSPNS